MADNKSVQWVTNRLIVGFTMSHLYLYRWNDKTKEFFENILTVTPNIRAVAVYGPCIYLKCNNQGEPSQIKMLDTTAIRRYNPDSFLGQYYKLPSA
jgi:hypothetical protein